MWKLACIAGGGAVGALLRYGAGSLVARAYGGTFPLATMTVNLAGSLAIGVCLGLFEQAVVSEAVRAGLLIGLLGAFTTFSTFSLETVQLLRDRQYVPALANVGISCAVGIALVFAGLFVGRWAAGAVR